MNKKLNNFLTGLICLLPVVILVLIFDLILGWIGRITELFPHSVWEYLGLPEFVVNVLVFVILGVLTWIIGFIMNQKRIGKKLTNLFSPIVLKVPLLSSLFKITHQITTTLQNTNSFKKVLLVRFPIETAWSVAFLTGENPEAFKDAVDEDCLVSVFIPTTPNPTNGYLVLMNPKNYVETEIPVSVAVSFIISMGTAGATKEIIKESHSNLEWDFFWNFKNFSRLCFFLLVFYNLLKNSPIKLRAVLIFNL